MDSGTQVDILRFLKRTKIYYELKSKDFFPVSLWRHVAAHPRRPLRLIHGVGVGLEGVEAALVRLAFHVVGEGLGVDEVLGAVHAVELPQAGLVQVHLLLEQLPGAVRLQVGGDLKGEAWSRCKM